MANKKRKVLFTLEAVNCTGKGNISDNLKTIKKMYPKHIISVRSNKENNNNTTIYEVIENDKK